MGAQPFVSAVLPPGMGRVGRMGAHSAATAAVEYSSSVRRSLERHTVRVGLNGTIVSRNHIQIWL